MSRRTSEAKQELLGEGNGTYQYILHQLDKNKDSYLDSDERKIWDNVHGVFQRAGAQGDVFEIGVILASFMNDARGIMLLLETVFYVENSLDDHRQTNPSK